MATATTAWRPTADEVAALVAHRPGDQFGVAQATFSATTLPTAAQVTSLIAQVQAEVVAETGDMPADLALPVIAGSLATSPAGRVVALGAASYVELQFFPDQQTLGDSPARQLWDRYQAAMKALMASVLVLKGGGTLGEADSDVLAFAWAFPAAVQTGAGTSSWEGY